MSEAKGAPVVLRNGSEACLRFIIKHKIIYCRSIAKLCEAEWYTRTYL